MGEHRPAVFSERDQRPTLVFERVLAPGYLGEDEGDLVDDAPGPVLARLDRAHDRVLGLRGVVRGMFVGRGVTAPDLSASATDTQVQPATADLQALLAPGNLRAGRDLGHLH